MSEASFADKAAITENIYRYCRGVDRADAELLSSAYHPDAVDEHGGVTFTGATEIGEGIVKLISASKISLHSVTNVLVDLHGPEAAGCESHFSAWQSHPRDGEDWMLHALGRYVDQVEKRAGEWKIAHRLVVVEVTMLTPPDAQMASSRPGLGRRDRTDPSYEHMHLK